MTNPNKQTCVDCGYEYEESKKQFHPPSRCKGRNPNLMIWDGMKKKKSTGDDD